MLRQNGVDVKTAQELLRHAYAKSPWRFISDQSAKKDATPRIWCLACFKKGNLEGKT
jgi:hypothetical protein